MGMSADRNFITKHHLYSSRVQDRRLGKTRYDVRLASAGCGLSVHSVLSALGLYSNR